MLQTFFFIVFVSIVTIIFGLTLLLLFYKPKPIVLNIQQLVLTFFCGLVLISLISSWITLFTSLNLLSLCPFIVIAVIILLYNKKLFQWKFNLNFQKAKYEVMLFLIACILFIQLGSLTPYMADTEIYHLQIIRWYQQFEVIPGLANLFPRYGFYSNWFHYISSFSLPYNQGSLLYANTTISIWFTLFLLAKMALFRNSTLKHKHFFTILYTTILLFSFFGWNLLRGNCRSLGNDFIVTILILYILLQIVETRLIETSEKLNKKILFILAISIPFFKLTGAFILPFLNFYFIQTKQRLRTYFFAGIITTLFITPFFIKNYIQTGYLIFPYTYFDIFSPDWKLPYPLAQRFQDFISLSNKYIYTDIPDKAWYHPSINWINTWFLKLALYDKVLIILFVISIPLLLLFTRLKNIYIKSSVIPLFTIIPITVIWFLLSPDPRFLYGFILFFAFYIFTSILLPFLKKNIIHSIHKFSCLTIILFSAYKISLFKGPLNTALTPEKPAYIKIEINNNFFYLAQKRDNTELLKCLDLPIPCIYSNNPSLQMRGSNLEDGFRMNKDLDSSFTFSYIY